MKMLQRTASCVVAALLIACNDAQDVTSPVTQCDQDYFVPPNAYVQGDELNDATESFLAQLRKGTGDIVIDGYVFLPDTLDLAPYIKGTTNHISITGTGGFTGRAIITGHLRLSKLSDSEVRMTDVTLYKGSLDFEYAQQTTLTRVRVQEQAFRVREYNRMTIRDSYMWKVDARFDQGLQLLWDAGAIESSHVVVNGYASNVANSYPGPITFNDVHWEYSSLRIDNARGVTLRGGYWFLTDAFITNSTDVLAERGEWILGDLYLDGDPQRIGCK
jgi:hypothetical protein